MTFNPAFFFALMALGYIINVAVTRDLSADRLLLRAPIVAAFATLLYGPAAIVGTEIAGLAVFLPIVVKDITPGKMLGKHA